jgi:SAM-dependent methyltransferase
MFFPEKITLVNAADRVLEIGPGADPHPRSDVLLELKMDSESDYVRQFGHERRLSSDKPLVFYDGVKFPFADKEFDYVICSHVLEHVPDVDGFLAEIFRVARRGYFEYPLITYEYLHNFDVHLNYLKWNGEQLRLMKKAEAPLSRFEPVHDVFRAMLTRGYTHVYNRLPEQFFEGWEWTSPFEVKSVTDMSELVPDASLIPVFQADVAKEYSFRILLRAMVKKLIG